MLNKLPQDDLQVLLAKLASDKSSPATKADARSKLEEAIKTLTPVDEKAELAQAAADQIAAKKWTDDESVQFIHENSQVLFKQLATVIIDHVNGMAEKTPDAKQGHAEGSVSAALVKLVDFLNRRAFKDTRFTEKHLMGLAVYDALGALDGR